MPGKGHRFAYGVGLTMVARAKGAKINCVKDIPHYTLFFYNCSIFVDFCARCTHICGRDPPPTSVASREGYVVRMQEGVEGLALVEVLLSFRRHFMVLPGRHLVNFSPSLLILPAPSSQIVG